MLVSATYLQIITYYGSILTFFALPITQVFFKFLKQQTFYEEVTYSETQIHRYWTNDDVKECKCSMNLINLYERACQLMTNWKYWL